MPPAADSAASAPWRRLEVETGEPAALLARSVELLDAMEPGSAPILRWYVPSTAALVLGRGQRPDDVRADLPIVRRHSGGGAVLLDQDLLSLDVVAPTGHPLVAGELGDVFVRVGRAWAAALGDLGLPGLTVHEGASSARRLGTPRERLLAAVCYALPGRGEVLHDGRKLVGLAQRRRRHGALVQCGLVLRWRPAPLLRALGADPDDAELRHAAVGLGELLSPPPPRTDIVTAVERRMVQPHGW